MSDDIVVRLKHQADQLEFGDPSEEIRARTPDLLNEAARLIVRLRSIAGKADVGPSFADIAKDLPRRSNEPADPS